jgi:hypothetical protein
MRSKAVLWLESCAAVVSLVLATLTLFWRDWIESLTGWDPDSHTGSVEMVVVLGLLVVAVALGALAHRGYRRMYRTTVHIPPR